MNKGNVNFEVQFTLAQQKVKHLSINQTNVHKIHMKKITKCSDFLKNGRI